MAVEVAATRRRFTRKGYRDVSLVAGAATLALQVFADVSLRTTDIFA